MGVELLGSVSFPSMLVDGLKLAGLSDLAWDSDENYLIAISDFGRIFIIEPDIDQGVLRGATVVRGVNLLTHKGRPLRGSAADAEGLVLEDHNNGVRGDTKLVIAFERQPRLDRHSVDGRYIDSLKLPGRLAELNTFQSPNKSLETIAFHPTQGFLIAPEWPLYGQSSTAIPIFNLAGEVWYLPRYDAPNAALVSMEVLADGSVITLERSFVDVLRPLRIILRRVPALPDKPQGQRLVTSEIAVFNSYRGWHLDNFEGLTRHQGNRFFLISDDNGSPFQRTLLVYLALDVARP